MNISESLRAHYAETFRQFGATSRGVDWEGAHKAAIRHEAMLRLIPSDVLARRDAVSVLDVGCGFGAFCTFLAEQGLTHIQYTGVDLVPEMVSHAREQISHATFLVGDVLDMSLEADVYDYVIANGVLTQKLSASNAEMDAFLERLVTRLFKLCRKGLAFNVMSKFVDFESPENYYRHPGEMADLAAGLTRRFAIDHAYPLYEYTVRMYK